MMLLDSKCSVVETCPNLTVVEFCPFESASNLLAYGNIDGITISFLTFQLTQRPHLQSTTWKPLISYETLVTFDYKG